jgi:RNA polymerase sigma-70 factor, ECF subfamily
MFPVAPSIPALARVETPDDLMQRFRAGDNAAFTQVVRRHYPQIARTVRRLMAWRGDFDDVTQEVFLVALRKRGSFRGDSSLATWLTAIAVRQCQSARRSGWWKRWRHRDEEPAAEPRNEFRDETAVMVHSAIAALPAKEREAIVLFYLEELSGAEVAKMLRISPGAVDVRLHRARRKLKDLLKNM